MLRRSSLLFAATYFVVVLSTADAFVTPGASVSYSCSTTTATTTRSTCASALPASHAADFLTTSEALPSTAISAATVDPTSFLSSVLGGLLGSPAILLIPILAAVSVASVVAWFIVWSANPADEDD